MNVTDLNSIYAIRTELAKLEKSIVSNSGYHAPPLFSQDNFHPSIHPFVSGYILFYPSWETPFVELKQAYNDYCSDTNIEPLKSKSFATELRIALTYTLSCKGVVFTPRNSHIIWRDIKVIHVMPHS